MGIAVPALYERWLKESLRILQLHEDVAVDESGRCNIIASVEDSTLLLWQRWERAQEPVAATGGPVSAGATGGGNA